MESVIRKELYNSVKTFWLNRDLLEQRILEAVRNLVDEHSEVEKVILFGSVAHKRETPLSDIDIIVIVKETNYRFLDRPLYFRGYFETIELATDIFVYTKEETKFNIPLLNTALKNGKVLFERQISTNF